MLEIVISTFKTDGHESNLKMSVFYTIGVSEYLGNGILE